ncbi:hypothetical protein [Mucilaginibacter sp. UR6-11]|uniref:hypothetical protein n=1 Tax=Mucilaginibacter sp. UR6-11 TaxID=1435644 RepID=UPI001E38B571|nr:hypothetical protein [Mucilaginibacter sp. UR6-11]MCC8423924.1 hypothetical protein [Mucilaginibacter sp. UR6-11]
MTVNKLCKHVFFILLLGCFSYTAYSQNLRMQSRQQTGLRIVKPQNPGMRRIQVVKETFIGQQLALTRQQGELFWPIYRQYQNELFEVRRLKRLNNSDAQANGAEQVKRDLDYDAQLVAIRKHYNEEFMKVLPPEKVSQLIKSEREFNDELVRKLHEQNVAKP